MNLGRRNDYNSKSDKILIDL